VVESRRERPLVQVLEMLAPGTVIRDGIERVIGAGRGALIVIGWTEAVERIVSGGFLIDTPATSQRIAELAKMDGALILDDDGERILRANVHLVPEPSIATAETGTRHRSAERTAKQTGKPVISVSESMSVVTLYWGERKRVLESVSSLLFRANQALSTLERYRARLDEVAATLSAREIEDAVALRDAALTIQRTEMVRRIAAEIQDYIAELGTEGRLIRLQLDELMASVEEDRVLTVRDYLADRRRNPDTVLEELGRLDIDEVLDLATIASVLAYDADELDHAVTARGYRLLSRIPRLPGPVIARLVERFENLPNIMEASMDDLDDVEGVGETRARSIQDGLRRLAETSILERYV
jgi:diadenylate cyclase